MGNLLHIVFFIALRSVYRSVHRIQRYWRTKMSAPKKSAQSPFQKKVNQAFDKYENQAEAIQKLVMEALNFYATTNHDALYLSVIVRRATGLVQDELIRYIKEHANVSFNSEKLEFTRIKADKAAVVTAPERLWFEKRVPATLVSVPTEKSEEAILKGLTATLNRLAKSGEVGEVVSAVLAAFIDSPKFEIEVAKATNAKREQKALANEIAALEQEVNKAA